MGTTTVSFTPATVSIGASVEGIDLGSLDEAGAAEVRAGLLEHQVLFFRDQHLDVDQHIALGRLFGDLHVHPTAPKGAEGRNELLRIHADADSTFTAGFKWHSDVSCDPEPPMGSILQLNTVPPTGGDTLFSSMYAAYDTLSEPMRGFLDGLTAVHSGAQVYTARFGRQPEAGKSFPESEHPVVRTHPETGRKALFVNENFTSHIVGLSDGESSGLLRILYDHIASPYHQCRFTWEPGSVAFWDNRCVQHLAVWDYFPNTRSGYRVTIAGDRPI